MLVKATESLDELSVVCANATLFFTLVNVFATGPPTINDTANSARPRVTHCLPSLYILKCTFVWRLVSLSTIPLFTHFPLYNHTVCVKSSLNNEVTIPNINKEHDNTILSSAEQFTIKREFSVPQCIFWWTILNNSVSKPGSFKVHLSFPMEIRIYH